MPLPISFRPPIPNVGLLLRRCSGKGLHLAMTGEPRGFSRVTAGFSKNVCESHQEPVFVGSTMDDIVSGVMK